MDKKQLLIQNIKCFVHYKILLQLIHLTSLLETQ